MGNILLHLLHKILRKLLLLTELFSLSSSGRRKLNSGRIKGITGTSVAGQKKVLLQTEGLFTVPADVPALL
jgi:hypothetical protein